MRKRYRSIAVLLVGLLALPAIAQCHGGFRGWDGRFVPGHAFPQCCFARRHDFVERRGFFRGRDFDHDRGRFRGFFGGVYAAPYYYYTPGYYYNPGYLYDPGYCSPGYYDVYGNWIPNPYCQ